MRLPSEIVVSFYYETALQSCRNQEEEKFNIAAFLDVISHFSSNSSYFISKKRISFLLVCFFPSLSCNNNVVYFYLLFVDCNLLFSWCCALKIPNIHPSSVCSNNSQFDIMCAFIYLCSLQLSFALFTFDEQNPTI